MVPVTIFRMARNTDGDGQIAGFGQGIGVYFQVPRTDRKLKGF
jgi:phage shock protein PspC (stress-responsive transcriptional regulator)